MWLSCIKANGYEFDSREILAITSWFKYKLSGNEPIRMQQMELTLKQLNEHRIARQNVVYLIETSIARGYRGIMEPTKVSANTFAAKPKLRYDSDEYITPENPTQKVELRNYLERCYLRDIIDPRTKIALTVEQRKIMQKHFANAEKQHTSFTDYVFNEEVSTGTCLLDIMVA